MLIPRFKGNQRELETALEKLLENGEDLPLIDDFAESQKVSYKRAKRALVSVIRQKRNGDMKLLKKRKRITKAEPIAVLPTSSTNGTPARKRRKVTKEECKSESPYYKNEILQQTLLKIVQKLQK